MVPAIAMILFAESAQPALEALSGTNFGLAATRGTMQLILAIALGLGATGALLNLRLTRTGRITALTAVLVLPFLGLRFGGWPGVAGAFGFGLLLIIVLSTRKLPIEKTQPQYAPHHRGNAIRARSGNPNIASRR